MIQKAAEKAASVPCLRRMPICGCVQEVLESQFHRTSELCPLLVGLMGSGGGKASLEMLRGKGKSGRSPHLHGVLYNCRPTGRISRVPCSTYTRHGRSALAFHFYPPFCVNAGIEPLCPFSAPCYQPNASAVLPLNRRAF